MLITYSTMLKSFGMWRLRKKKSWIEWPILLAHHTKCLWQHVCEREGWNAKPPKVTYLHFNLYKNVYIADDAGAKCFCCRKLLGVWDLLETQGRMCLLLMWSYGIAQNSWRKTWTAVECVCARVHVAVAGVNDVLLLCEGEPPIVWIFCLMEQEETHITIFDACN